MITRKKIIIIRNVKDIQAMKNIVLYVKKEDKED